MQKKSNTHYRPSKVARTFSFLNASDYETPQDKYKQNYRARQKLQTFIFSLPEVDDESKKVIDFIKAYISDLKQLGNPSPARQFLLNATHALQQQTSNQPATETNP